MGDIVEYAVPGLKIKQKHNIKEKGLQQVVDEHYIKIYNDPFGSMPLFMAKTIDDKYFLFSDFRSCFSRKDIALSVDKAGFWEIVLFGTPVWSRTLFKNIYQLPAGSELEISKKTGHFKISRYWDFNVYVNNKLTEKSALAGLHEHLLRIFSGLSQSQQYVMGLSAGLDSRLSIAYLSQLIPRESLSTFTFGYSPRLLEYQQAIKVAKAYGFSEPVFHQLTPASYLSSLSMLSKMTAGQIGMLHCHICDYLKNNAFSEGVVQLSNYYTDALFGYATSVDKTEMGVEEDGFFRTAYNCEYIDSNTREEILGDIENVFNMFSVDANFSSSFEYRYLTERTPKFHSLLAFTQGHFLPTVMPYADLELMEFMVSVPHKFKAHKQMLDKLQERYFQKHQAGFTVVSSRGFQKVGKTTKYDSAKRLFNQKAFKALNCANAGLRAVTQGRIQILNVYQTEEQDRVMRRDFATILKTSLEYLHDANLIDDKAFAHFGRIPLRGGVGCRGSIIDIATLLTTLDTS